MKYCQVKLAKIVDDFKREINLQEATTDKLIQANPLLFKEPKVERLIEGFKELFKEELEEQNKEQTLEEQIAIFRSMK